MVGVGASAGGLGALTQLIAALPSKPGLALVVIQHLDPFHESRLSELLRRGDRLFRIGGDLAPREVAAGDVVLIPPLCRQRITNVGKHDLAFLAICTPRFEQRNYEDVENP